MGGYKKASFVGIAIVILGGAVLGYGLWFLVQQINLEAGGELTTGQVFEIEHKAIYQSPWVRFITKEGQEVVFKSELAQNVDIFPYSIGQEVTVIYNPQNPQQAKMYAFWERHFEPVFLSIVGLFMLFFGFFYAGFFCEKPKNIPLVYD
ncbi:DUF3592 domain-containing protein [Eisenibacter elegans]|uniref:DUF3592 domain-containing protein n=1 Tax=Eisenibacter elegans TaxID=997 RepID=UPI000418D621|nr:DUF3592 domain-containing protein [Eisenibacter elegans]